MKSTLFIKLLGVIIYVLSSSQLHGQSRTKTVVLKQGEVLDILLLSQRPNSDKYLKTYFQTAFPVAKQMSYQSAPSFKIKKLLSGNHSPSSLILGKWSGIEKREHFLTEITKKVPDFHEQRRKIWSYFGLCYFEIHEDLTFKIDLEKFNVATAYWFRADEEFNSFSKKWKKQLTTMNGNVLIQLQDGHSPFGYHYKPDYLVISSWENKEQFNSFKEKIKQLGMNKIKHLNEFVIE